MTGALGDLERRLWEAAGSDSQLDAAIAQAFGRPIAPFTGGVAECRALVAAALPGWALHLGYDASGVFPYAALARGQDWVMSEAPTVPLAILRSAAAAGIIQARSEPPPA